MILAACGVKDFVGLGKPEKEPEVKTIWQRGYVCRHCGYGPLAFGFHRKAEEHRLCRFCYEDLEWVNYPEKFPVPEFRSRTKTCRSFKTNEDGRKRYKRGKKST